MEPDNNTQSPKPENILAPVLGGIAGLLMLTALGIINIIIPPIPYRTNHGNYVVVELTMRIICAMRFSAPVVITALTARSLMHKHKTFARLMLVSNLVVGIPITAYFVFIAITHLL
jgi:hypothetical protein